MNRLSHAVILFVLLLYPNVTQAEPSKTVEYLMNEPVSMLDLGILRLDRKLGKSESNFNYADKSLKMILGFANYDYEKNRIILSFLHYLNTDLFKTKGWTPQTVCKDQLSRVRNEFGFNDDDSKRSYSTTAKDALSIANSFTHIGYQKKNAQNNLQSEIENISYVEIDIKEDCLMCLSYRTLVKCEGSLYGKEVLFHDK